MDAAAALTALFEAGLAHCRSLDLDTSGPVVGALALAGLTGGLLHCTGMCGPFVLSQVAARLEAVPVSRLSERARWAGALLAPYHLGRLLTYTVLGAGSAALVGQGGSLLADQAVTRGLSAVLMGLAALLFLMHALPRLGVWLPLPRLPGPPARWIAPLMAAPTGGRGLLLGVILGFLPCGLLYGAVAGAASTADPVMGGLGMAAFAAGTVPGLVAVGLVGHLAGRRWQGAVARGAPLLLVLNALVLLVLAARALS
ncbi:sulfite exporter TauE/SafE family protein [Pararhodospirillum oryzae]|uniref:Membrane protein n=1 Tax=Pararhodospirillum oryzae TaxID=478448 RepID=A0A512H8D6_9PROT|nr:sulfite exporter TauE/SafE family protein [Pararhodospirillum oryzae]GEO81688.1 membrane protein [Pararhodospirillum oryzae]